MENQHRNLLGETGLGYERVNGVSNSTRGRIRWGEKVEDRSRDIFVNPSKKLPLLQSGFQSPVISCIPMKRIWVRNFYVCQQTRVLLKYSSAKNWRLTRTAKSENYLSKEWWISWIEYKMLYFLLKMCYYCLWYEVWYIIVKVIDRITMSFFILVKEK
jgi:hypothetical protein